MGTTRSIITKTATVLAGGITVLSMSACGLQISFGETGGSNDSSTDTDRREDENTRQDTDAPETHNQNRGSDTSAGSGSSSGTGADGSDSGTDAGGSDSGTGAGGPGSGTRAGGSGNGTGAGGSGSGSYSGGSHRVPGHVLAADIKQVAEADLGISGITVDCNDLHARSVGSTTTCTMDVPGDKKYFPLAKVTKIDGTHVTYDLEFPGVDF